MNSNEPVTSSGRSQRVDPRLTESPQPQIAAIQPHCTFHESIPHLLQLGVLREDQLDTALTAMECQQIYQLLSLYVEQSALGVIGWDAELRVTLWSQQAEQIFGWQAKDVLGESWQTLSIVHPADWAIVQQSMERSVCGSTAICYATRNYRQDGKLIDCEWQQITQSQNPDQRTAIFALVQDVSARRRTEAELRRRIELEQVISRITQRIRQSLDLNEILTTAVNEVRQLLQADRVLVFQLTADGIGVVIKEAVLPAYPETLKMYWQDQCFPAECYEYYCQAQPRIVPDVKIDRWANCLTEFMQGASVKSKIVAPIVQDKQESLDHLTQSSVQPQVWGLLVVHACAEHRLWQTTEAELLQQIANQLAIAIQQANLYAQVQAELAERKLAEMVLRQQAEYERLIGDMTQRIRQSLNLTDILHTTVEEVRQLLQVDRTLIYSIEPDESGMVMVESVTSPSMSILGKRIQHQGLQQEPYLDAYLHGQVQAISDIKAMEQPESYIHLLRSLQVQASLIVGIVVSEQTYPSGESTHIPTPTPNRLWGLLVAQHCRNVRLWSPMEIDLLRQLAVQVGIAIQQSELYQQVQVLNTRLEGQVQERTAELQRALDFEALLKRITDRVRDSLDEGQILQTAVEELTTELRVNACDAALYHLETRTSTICYESIHAGVKSAVGVTISMEGERRDIYTQILQGHSVQCCVWCEKRGFTDPVAPLQPMTVLICPLMDERGVLGDMWLFKPMADVFEATEIRLVQQVATHCAIALRQSRLYQAAQAQVQELERLSQLKDDFLNTISHELRTPMSSIQLAIQMLELTLFDPAKSGQVEAMTVVSSLRHSEQYFQILQQECQREINLIDDLLELTRLDAKTEPLMLTGINLALWLPHLVEPFIERTQQQQQTIVLTIPEQLPTLTTDLSYLQRMLMELLTNACKYTPAGEYIRLSVETLPDEILLCVANSGVEIPLAERDRIFDRFYRIPNNDPWKYSGTGLGLALVKKLAEQLGITIRLESANNQTTFQLKIPLFPLE
ncbi:GAF domain-containing protein [Pantanalinema sp. GBBB05]|uniref:sensor histidine kinase n=1 Tax=Pantanalinema sp. GBBB05 TaxID=2604139 RepID=UPI001DD1B5BC|nr:GAF domain-containing protein [Pantanalinema sp. GBBB05]